MAAPRPRPAPSAQRRSASAAALTSAAMPPRRTSRPCASSATATRTESSSGASYWAPRVCWAGPRSRGSTSCARGSVRPKPPGRGLGGGITARWRPRRRIDAGIDVWVWRSGLVWGGFTSACHVRIPRHGTNMLSTNIKREMLSRVSQSHLSLPHPGCLHRRPGDASIITHAP
ncbi:hypothetical protein CT0861_13013 [Colletotrichum tofieldiae]|uniref:Uncharacterized protein n=1 Tax=Colletotrichum tofieldiae TaxID=708197 RepID=A0A166LWP5_9PEZI|nr:hypothetical protein CT0861_13013 [Colletotrichum tofieldiae]